LTIYSDVYSFVFNIMTTKKINIIHMHWHHTTTHRLAGG